MTPRLLRAQPLPMKAGPVNRQAQRQPHALLDPLPIVHSPVCRNKTRRGLRTPVLFLFPLVNPYFVNVTQRWANMYSPCSFLFYIFSPAPRYMFLLVYKTDPISKSTCKTVVLRRWCFWKKRGIFPGSLFPKNHNNVSMFWRVESSLDYLDNGFRQLSRFCRWFDIPIY